MSTTLNAFRAQFLSLAGDLDHSACVGEGDLVGDDFDAALSEASEIAWPAGATACRLSDPESGNVAYRIVRDAGLGGTLIVRFG